MRQPLRRFGTGLAGTVVTAFVGIALVGCPDPVDWSDYTDVNLIAARDFDAVDSDGNALWYFSEGLTIATEGAADFVTWEVVGADVYGSLPSGVTGAVYRLEVNNLLRNGDFEDADLAATGWIEHDHPADNPDGPTIGHTTSGPLAGSGSLSINFFAAEDRYYIDLAAALAGVSDENVDYAYHLDFKMPVNTIGIEINNGITVDVQSQWQITRGEGQSEMVVYQYPGAGLTSPAMFSKTNEFVLGSNTSWKLWSFGGLDALAQERIEGLFDNLRIVRADQGHYVRLPVPYRDSLDTARPPLISGGTYTISVWVKPDPTAGTNNRIPARLFSAGLDTSVANSAITPGKSVTVFTAGPENLEALTDWRQLSFAVDGSTVDVTAATGDNDVLFDVVLEVGRFAGGSEYADAGSILVSGPRLEWSPN